MYVDFARPWALLMMPAAVIFVIWFGRCLNIREKSHRFSLIFLRALVMALAILAVSGVSIRRQNDAVTTVFLLDLSDSMHASEEKEEEFVRQALSDMGTKDQAGIVVFGSDARIEQFVSDKKAFTSVQSTVSAGGTNLEQAVQTALALFPEDSAKRLVLLTDGSENEGELSETVEAVAGDSVECKVVNYDSFSGAEVYVSDVTLPDTIRQGDSFQVEAEIYASESTQATVSLYSGRTLKGQQDVMLQKGYNQLLFADEGLEGGLKNYRVTVEAEQDTVTVNNTYSAFTTVEAQAKLLLVEGSAGESEAFAQILDACNYDYDVVTPAGVPGQIADMTQYESIILLDVYADDLREGFLDTLKTYVKDYAGGLIAIGGENSFALGNYKDTPLEEVLPVSMDLEGEKEVPKIAMAMVIDHSGSMDTASTGQSNVTCMDIAKQAAASALDSLREIDEVGVLAFDDTYAWAVQMQTAEDKDSITSGIAGIRPRGGTNIYPALVEAEAELEKSDAKLKHIILLTDGQDGYRGYSDVLEKMNNAGIILSTVAVGTGADTSTLQSLAEKGGGRYYYSDAGTALPRIFAQEVYLSSQSYLIQEEFVPTIVNSHEITQGIFDGGSPSLLGYIASTPKSAATVLLESDREDPILTVWQYGLGRSVAWNSDGTGEWTGNFSGWDSYAALWRNIIDWTISKSDLGEDQISLTQEGDSLVLTYETDEFSADTQITALMTDEDGNQQEVQLSAVSPGVYRAYAKADEVGVYSINVRKQNGEEVIKNINTAAAKQYSNEYRFADVTNVLDSYVSRVGGRFITDPSEVFDTQLESVVSQTDITQLLIILALLLFAADIAFRRLSVDWAALFIRGASRLRAHRPHRAEKKEKQMQSKPAGVTQVEQKEKQEVSKKDEMKKESSVKEADAGSGTDKPRKKPAKENPKKTKERQAETIDTAALLKKKQDRSL